MVDDITAIVLQLREDGGAAAASGSASEDKTRA